MSKLSYHQKYVPRIVLKPNTNLNTFKKEVGDFLDCMFLGGCEWGGSCRFCILHRNNIEIKTKFIQNVNFGDKTYKYKG